MISVTIIVAVFSLLSSPLSFIIPSQVCRPFHQLRRGSRGIRQQQQLDSSSN
jgi:hypothetical protein